MQNVSYGRNKPTLCTVISLMFMEGYQLIIHKRIWKRIEGELINFMKFSFRFAPCCVAFQWQMLSESGLKEEMLTCTSGMVKITKKTPNLLKHLIQRPHIKRFDLIELVSIPVNPQLKRISSWLRICSSMGMVLQPQPS